MSDFPNLKLIPAKEITADLDKIPASSAVYLFFVNGGDRLLDATSYFDFGGSPPAMLGGHAHLYTGAATDLRLRMKQHFHRDRRASTFRETLLAIEQSRKAISKSLTPLSAVSCETTLNSWLFENITIGFRHSKRPFHLEYKILQTHASPFNITLRRSNAYARALMQWRHETFPRWRHPSRIAEQPSRINRATFARSISA